MVEELYASALNPAAIRLVDRHVGALEKAARLVAPTFQDGKEAGKLVAQITRREPARKTKIQQMFNDILLALSTRRIGGELFIFNRGDFELNRRYKPFSSRTLRG